MGVTPDLSTNAIIMVYVTVIEERDWVPDSNVALTTVRRCRSGTTPSAGLYTHISCLVQQDSQRYGVTCMPMSMRVSTSLS